MKFIFFLVASFLVFTACNSTAQDQSGNNFTNLEVAQFKAKMDDPDIVVLDVRTPRETAGGMIEGAVAIDVKARNFKEKVMQLDTSKTYLVYCRSGRRSAAACNIMADQGFKNLYNLKGGYLQWRKQ
jgi:rhodanese-related sulfurtransferase